MWGDAPRPGAPSANRKQEWLRYPASAKVFLKPDRSAFRSGELWRQPDLALTLRRLQEHGRAGFYAGEGARRLAADMQNHGGLITEADLAAYEAKMRPPVHGTYRGFDVYSMPPPSSGGVALVEMLNLLEGLGFFYNNEMGDFNPQPGRTDRLGFIGTPPNLVAPGKRMLSSMTPTILAKGGKPCLVIGSPGGRTIINTVLQVVLNVVDFDMDPASAVAAKRVHHQWLPDELVAEPDAISSATRRRLKTMGYPVRVRGKIGQVMGIFVDPATGQRFGVADPRASDGSAAGY